MNLEVIGLDLKEIDTLFDQVMTNVREIKRSLIFLPKEEKNKDQR